VEAMAKVGGRIADRAAGLAFSVESVYAEGALGFHAAYKWVTAEEMASILEDIRRMYRKMEAGGHEAGRRGRYMWVTADEMAIILAFILDP